MNHAADGREGPVKLQMRLQIGGGLEPAFNNLAVEIAENDIGLDDGLRTVVGLDSVGFVELRVLCEQRFNVEINDNDYTPENFTSIRLLATLIDRLQAQKAAV